MLRSPHDGQAVTVTRYTDGGPEGWMQTPTGEFVRYEDYERLRQEIERLQEEDRIWEKHGLVQIV